MHETALMGMQSREFIRNRDLTKPFCLSVSFKAPHGEDGVKENNGFRPDPYFDNLYTGTFFPFPPTYADSFYLRFPPAFRKNHRGKENEARVRWTEKFSTREKYQETVRAIYRLVSGIDKVVGELRDFLREQGLEKNTIIVITSDNGYYLGEHGLEGKWYGHEESIRVPLIIYDPRLPKKIAACDKMILNIDMAPTILDWAEIPIPASMQGKSLLPLLRGPVRGWRQEFFYEHRYDPGNYPVYIPHTAGIVTERFKYMRYYNGPDSEKNIVHEELFDRSADRHEVINLVYDSKWEKNQVELKKKVIEYEKKLQ
jgi:arylsulfatase A-like enzyme